MPDNNIFVFTPTTWKLLKGVQSLSLAKLEIEKAEFHRLFDGFPHSIISQPRDDYLAYQAPEFGGNMH